MVQLYGVEKVLPLVPAVGGVVLVIAAIYARSISGVIGNGLNKLHALGRVPARDRVEAIKVLEVGLDIGKVDIDGLDPQQRYELVKATLEERMTKVRHRFWLLLITGLMMFLFATGWLVYSFASQTQQEKLEQAIKRNPSVFADVLAEKSYYSTDSLRLVDALAGVTGINTADLKKAMEQAKVLDGCTVQDNKDCKATLVELRQRARDRKPPFNEIGMFVTVGKPRDDQPRRFQFYVTDRFPFKNVPVEVLRPDGNRSLILFPKVAIHTSPIRGLVHLNDEQLSFLFNDPDLLSAPKDNASTGTLVVRPATDQQKLVDPACAEKWIGRDPLCDIKEDDIAVDRLADASVRRS